MKWRRLLVGVAAIGGGLAVGAGLLLAWPTWRAAPMEYGVTFSQPQAQYIGLDWQEAYEAMLDDLGVRRLRLVAYWNIVEPEADDYDWRDLDWQMDEAAERGAKVMLAVGRKVPRWPECHIPEWARDLSEAEQQEEVKEMVGAVVERYREHPALERWQLENEPFLDFGECPVSDEKFFAEEEALVRAGDSLHPIVVTDSGELNWWLKVAQYGDVVGTTMYRTVWSGRTNSPFSYDYLFPAWMYRLKSRYVKLLTGKEVVIAELQGEPWGAAQFPDMTEEERRAVFSLARMMELADFAERTQLPEAYWWGVEYWYWEKSTHGEDTFWEYGKRLFNEGGRQYHES